MNRRTTAAKASFISTRSMSSTVSPAFASALRVAGAGPVSMITGSAPDTAALRIRARGVSPLRRPASSLPTTTSAAPSTMPLELPAVCTCSIRSTQWYFCRATASKPPMSPIPANDDGRAASDSTVVPGADQLVVVEDHGAVPVAHRYDRPVEVAVRPRLRRPGLRLGGVGVDVLAAPALQGGDEVGTDPLRHESGGVRRLRVHGPRAAVGPHGHPGHGLDASGEDEVLEARPHLLRRQVDRLEAARAEAVDLHPGDGVGQPSDQRGRAGDHGALLADR